ncbi:hypothetical protein GCM10010280_43460 [Streptomyces pilosus]|uniref:Uncharacterized protein n=1 Tax=Streptomyces pilosus TaxID=28893 RepID=A0A918BTK2_9ACTN|nr:hypothetical protein GCM10010280_43460 [Streptomyces pilosus]
MPSGSVAKLTMWVPPYAVRPVSLATCWLSLTTASGSGTKVSSMPLRVRTTPGGPALEHASISTAWSSGSCARLGRRLSIRPVSRWWVWCLGSVVVGTRVAPGRAWALKTYTGLPANGTGSSSLTASLVTGL